MNTCGLFTSFKNMINKKQIEQIEKLKDEYYYNHYTDSATKHLNRILKTYNRQTHQSFDKSLSSVRNIGLYEPCADNIKYLKHMRWVSIKY